MSREYQVCECVAKYHFEQVQHSGEKLEKGAGEEDLNEMGLIFELNKEM